MCEEPDFYISAAGENSDLSEPRACWVKCRLRNNIRDDYMLVEIAPPVIGQSYGLGGKDISQLVIATRHLGFSLFPITEWPSYVHIYRILDESIISEATFDVDQIEVIAWGMIFKTLDQAREALSGAV